MLSGDTLTVQNMHPAKTAGCLAMLEQIAAALAVVSRAEGATEKMGRVGAAARNESRVCSISLWEHHTETRIIGLTKARRCWKHFTPWSQR